MGSLQSGELSIVGSWVWVIFRSKVCDFILYIYAFDDIFIVFEYLFIHCNIFRDPRIELHIPYEI